MFYGRYKCSCSDIQGQIQVCATQRHCTLHEHIWQLAFDDLEMQFNLVFNLFFSQQAEADAEAETDQEAGALVRARYEEANGKMTELFTLFWSLMKGCKVWIVEAYNAEPTLLIAACMMICNPMVYVNAGLECITAVATRLATWVTAVARVVGDLLKKLWNGVLDVLDCAMEKIESVVNSLRVWGMRPWTFPRTPSRLRV